MIKTLKDRNDNKFGEYDVPEKGSKDIKAHKFLGDEMVNCPISSSDYIEQGYRCYRVSEFDATFLAQNLPNICRKHKLEMMVIKGIIYIKDTKKYDQPKNPYT